ncbi:hypothetical protein WA026_005626 [Henosepilachna vigintioctopunctata]|uniref:Serpin domain-containing protein n=1 Tax=Henosepilachna vigintioctopunctata TaxID=420089 RepID=A0AAW1U2D2_9CUCU
MLKIPYQNKKADLIIMLPDDIDGFHRVEKDARKLWKERNFNRQHTTLYLPKFKVESNIDMIPIMKNMGKISIGVDEIGTESDNTVPDVAAHEEIIDTSNKKVEIFKADHPFLFAVVYDGFSLLVGRYSGPETDN